jgi:5,10-methylene-tetrahydrofolate dehydrogenase/methenyl tetrahydrofolate cyclohydrolase
MLLRSILRSTASSGAPLLRHHRAFGASVISGTEISKDVRADVAASSAEMLAKFGERPGLAVVLVGDRPDSAKYVSMKKKAAAECGFLSIEKLVADDVSQEELLSVVAALNADDEVDGVLVQLPLPEHLDQKEILRSISVEKDVDGFHPTSVGALTRLGEELRQRRDTFQTNKAGNVPCTPLGCIELLDRTGIELSGLHVVVLGRSNIVGLPAALMAVHRNATVTMAHSRTKDLPAVCRQADVLIAAVGQPEMVKADWIKPGATVIDVGVNFLPDAKKKSGMRMCGDVDYPGCKEVAGHITPVPGGVGPMTVAMLMRNTLTNAQRRVERLKGSSMYYA